MVESIACAIRGVRVESTKHQSSVSKGSGRGVKSVGGCGEGGAKGRGGGAGYLIAPHRGAKGWRGAGDLTGPYLLMGKPGSHNTLGPTADPGLSAGKKRC